MIFPIFFFLQSTEAQDNLPARSFKWQHNHPKEDPLQRKNFQAEVEGTCNEEIVFSDPVTGQIATPNFENNYYSNDSDCTWIISTNEKYTIAYEIAYLDLEPGPPFCPFDYIEVEKKVDGEFVTQQDPSFLWRRYCGAMRPMGFTETDSNEIKIHFVSDDYEHGRGAVINWKIHDKNKELVQLAEEQFDEIFIDFEDGWGSQIDHTGDEAFPDTFEWMLGRGYTTSIGTGPRRDRTTMTVYGTYAYFDTSEPRRKGDTAVFSILPHGIAPEDDYCLQFYAVLYGDEFGQMETFIQYYDENDERIEMVSIGMINQESVPQPPVDDWLPFQYAIKNIPASAVKASIIFKAVRGRSPQGDFALDDITWFRGQCSDKTPFLGCARTLKNPFRGGIPVGFWNCSDSFYMGSTCNLICMEGYMVTPGYEPINHCTEDGMFGGWSDDPGQMSCQKNYCTFPKPDPEGIWFFGCTDEKNQNIGIITEGGSCELRCLPGYERQSPQLMACIGDEWRQLKASSGAYTDRRVGLDEISCKKIPESKLTVDEKRRIENFSPPRQLGSEEENKKVETTKRTTTTTKASLPEFVKTSKAPKKIKEEPKKEKTEKRMDEEEESPTSTQIPTTFSTSTESPKENEPDKDEAPKPTMPAKKETQPPIFARPGDNNEDFIGTTAAYEDLFEMTTPSPNMIEDIEDAIEEVENDKKKKKRKDKSEDSSASSLFLSALLLCIFLL